MSAFKDIIARDVHQTFLNPDEFSDIHKVNGKDMPVQIDTNEQIEREKRMNQNVDGVYTNQKLIYVAASDFGAMPKQGAVLNLDGKIYRVADAVGGLEGLIHGDGHAGLGHRDAQAIHDLAEAVAILGKVDDLGARA